MTRALTIAGVGLALLVVTSVLPPGLVGVGSAMPPDSDVYTITQGTNCWEVQPWEPGDTNPETGEPIRPHVEVIQRSEEGGEFENDSWDGTPTIESIMAYRYRDPSGGVHDNPHPWGQRPRYAPWLAEYYWKEGWSYGTYGLWNWSTNQESHLFLFGGPEGDSVVLRHDKLYDDTAIGSHDPYNGMNGPRDGFMSRQDGGGSASFIFRNLPAGEWAYMDDLYPENMDSIYYPSGEFDYDSDRHTRLGTYHNNYGAEPLSSYDGGTNFTAHWTWGDNGTDGGAYRGLENLELGEGITIEPRFNEESYFWERQHPSQGDGVAAWVLLRKNGERIRLDMDQPVRIVRGGYCLAGDLDADPGSIEAGQPVTFTADSGASEYRWDVDGDGRAENVTDSRSLTRTFEGAGDRQVTVTMVSDVLDRNGTASTTVAVQSASPPTADFTVDDDAGDPSHVVAGETVTLNGSASSDNAALADSFRWNVSGDSATGERVSYSFSSPGEYEVTLRVADQTGRNDTVTETVTVVAQDDPSAAADASPTQVEAGAPVPLDASGSSDGNGSVETYEWSTDAEAGTVTEDDGGTGTPGATATFESPGDYRVNLTVTDNNGNADTASAAVNVTAGSDPTIDDVTVPSEVSVSGSLDVSASASDNSERSLDYIWTFSQEGNSETGNGSSASYSFDSVGTASVELTVRDAAGRTNHTERTVDVTAGPSASLSVPDEIDTGTSVTLDASGSSDRDGGIDEYRWDVDGDGQVDQNGTDPTVSHTYESAGTYEPTVTVVDADGQTATASASITVQEREALRDSDGGGGSAGGGGGTSLGPPPVVTETEAAGPNGALVDVRNARSDEPVEADLPESDAAERTGVGFERLAVDLRSDDTHVAFETAASATAPEGVTALDAPDETLAYLDLGARYLDTRVTNATVEVAVNRSALGGLSSGDNVAVYRYDGGWQQVDATVVAATDRGYRIEATANGLGTLAVGANRPLAVADAALANRTVATGDPVRATATVENRGTAARTATVNLTLGGTAVATETVEVPAGESTEVTLAGPAPATGNYTVAVGGTPVGNLTVRETLPADTSVTDVALNRSTIEAGQRVEITATVENAGGEPGERAVTLRLFGDAVATKNVTVPAGGTAEVTFVRQVNAAGNYTVEVGERTASLGVTSADDGGLDAAAPDVPGFGVGAALVALVAATLLARLRD